MPLVTSLTQTQAGSRVKGQRSSPGRLLPLPPPSLASYPTFSLLFPLSTRYLPPSFLSSSSPAQPSNNFLIICSLLLFYDVLLWPLFLNTKVCITRLIVSCVSASRHAFITCSQLSKGSGGKVVSVSIAYVFLYVRRLLEGIKSEGKKCSMNCRS